MSIQEIDYNGLILARNLKTLHEYIARNIIHEPLAGSTPLIDTSQSSHILENSQTLIDSFGRLDVCVLQLPYVNDKTFSTRLHFAIRCAKGGLMANDRDLGCFAEDLTNAFETWGTLNKELRIIGAADESLMGMRQSLDDYMYELGDRCDAIEKVLHPRSH